MYKKMELAQKLAIIKKSAIFIQSFWNLAKELACRYNCLNITYQFDWVKIVDFKKIS